MTYQMNIEVELENVRQLLPDPFRLAEEHRTFCQSPEIQALLAGDLPATVSALLNYLKVSIKPYLVHAAVLVLACVDPSLYYRQLLATLRDKEKAIVEAHAAGLWLIDLPEEQIARDLIDLINSSGNVNLLLLLQHPASQSVRSTLAAFIRERQFPKSLYALYAYGYGLEAEDNALLLEVVDWNEMPATRAQAGIYLLQLGSQAGIEGIRAGLTASDADTRAVVYYSLVDYLPLEVRQQAAYDPEQAVETQQAAIEILMASLAKI